MILSHKHMSLTTHTYSPSCFCADCCKAERVLAEQAKKDKAQGK